MMEGRMKGWEDGRMEREEGIMASRREQGL